VAIVSLLSQLFGRKRPRKQIAEMSFAELIATMREGKDGIPARDLIQIARRVTDIALFEHGVSGAERDIALELLPALDEDIKAGLRSEPGAWEAYQEAAVFHRSGARHNGFGSLHWKMEEEGIEAVDIVPFIARKEHAELLPAFLEMLEPDVIREIRGALLGELATARAERDELPIEVLGRLANGEDGALTHLLDGSQLGALRRAAADPEKARETLRNLGLDF
jgi:hypothetical protein